MKYVSFEILWTFWKIFNFNFLKFYKNFEILNFFENFKKKLEILKFYYPPTHNY